MDLFFVSVLSSEDIIWSQLCLKLVSLVAHTICHPPQSLSTFPWPFILLHVCVERFFLPPSMRRHGRFAWVRLFALTVKWLSNIEYVQTSNTEFKQWSNICFATIWNIDGHIINRSSIPSAPHHRPVCLVVDLPNIAHLPSFGSHYCLCESALYLGATFLRCGVSCVALKVWFEPLKPTVILCSKQQIVIIVYDHQFFSSTFFSSHIISSRKVITIHGRASVIRMWNWSAWMC